MRIERRKFLGLTAAGVVGAACLRFPLETALSKGRRGFMTGMLARQSNHLTTANAPYLTGFVLELKWSEAQSVYDGAILSAAVTKLNEARSKADQFNKKIKLRILGGKHSPNFVLPTSGNLARITGWIDGQSPGTPHTIARWWRGEYLDAYKKFIKKLCKLNTFNSNRWREVTISGPMTIFAEPCIRQINGGATVQPNRDKLRAILQSLGQTTDKFNTENVNAVREAIDIHKNAFDSFGIVSSLAYNPWEVLSPTFGNTPNIISTTKYLMDEQRSRLANMGIWQNNSLAAVEENGVLQQVRGNFYQEMYDKMQDRTWFSQYQTASLANLANLGGNIYDTVRYAAQNYGLSVEMPFGWENDPTGRQIMAEAGALNQQMAENEFCVKYP